ncbi:hypothetical protein AX15_007738 [Amanita polypyramis BW_CC]|nr:hypothetical protein AX15_007738 [Amanita polypyramis BW_CC]
MAKKLRNVVPMRLYFGYGSNMWKDQMHRRCPESKLVGVGVFRDWKWIIETAGYATIIPSLKDRVYGLLYEISPSDEESLDAHEPIYIKKTVNVEIIKGHHTIFGSQEGSGSEHSAPALVYIDIERTSEGLPRKEYITRMNYAIKDALEEGVPEEYVKEYLRPFIPEGLVLAK